MDIELLSNVDDIGQVTEVHMNAFENFFLTFLGRGFLNELYAAFVSQPNSGVYVIRDSGTIVAFLAYSERLSSLYKYLIRKKLIKLGWFSFCAFLKKPSIMFRLLRAFLYPGNSVRNEEYVELSSIGVLPQYSNRGYGSALIQRLIKDIDFNKYSYISLETDAENNEKANAFYKHNGFVLDHEYTTPEGRKMNEYHYQV